MTISRPDMLVAIHAAFERLVDTVDSFTAEDFAAPSLLPGWTRAHVVAHLRDNAAGFARALEGLVAGEPAYVYDSDQARDANIEAGAQESGEALLASLVETQKRLRSVLQGLTDQQWAATIERTAGGRQIAVADIPANRWREIEIHHCDLGADYSFADWPEPFADFLVRDLAAKMADRGSVTLEIDGGETLVLGAGETCVRGTAAALAWWLARQDPRGVESDGEIPDLGGL